MAWVYLLAAGLLEVAWATALKYSDGFTRLWPSLVSVVAAAASFLLLALALRSLPIATGYAIWVGIGVLGTAAIGILALGEPAGTARLCLLSLILAGVIGLKLVGE